MKRKKPFNTESATSPAAEPDPPRCSVDACTNHADYAVLLCDLYPANRVEDGSVVLASVFLQQDFTCEYVCEEHAFENEARARGLPMPGSDMKYPFSLTSGARGFSLYVPVRDWQYWNGDEPRRSKIEIVPFDSNREWPPDPPLRCEWRPLPTSGRGVT